jgi:hypothetical protein
MPLGVYMDNDALQSRVGSEPGGPPPTEQEVQAAAETANKGKPHHLEARLASLDPELQELFTKTLADKEIFARTAKMNSERLAKTEAKLNEIAQAKAESDRKQLEEQGEFKKLAEQERARANDLENKLFAVQVHSNLERELANSGALDAEMVSTFLLSKYGDELKSDPSKVAELVNSVKEAKPLLFKQLETAPQQPSTPQQRSSGLPTSSPPAGGQPSQFDARNKKIPLSEVEKLWKDATKDANWFSN